MTKQDNTLIWVIGIVVILFLILPNVQQKQDDEGIGLSVHYYNNGVEVFPQKNLFSIVTPPGGSYDAISFSILGTNTGNTDLTNIKIVGATPLAFKNALPTSTQTLLKGQTKTLWSSELISTSQFESMAQPVRFWLNVSTEAGPLKGSATSYKDLTITPYIQPSLCYQEFADISNICGAKSTGYYSLSPYYFYSTYAKPTGALPTSTWQVKFGGRATENITIPSSCWNYSSTEIKFRFYSNAAASIRNPSVYGQCYDGNWGTITSIVIFPGGTRSSPAIDGNNLLYDGNWNTGAYSYYGNQLFYKYQYDWADTYATIWEEAMWWRFKMIDSPLI